MGTFASHDATARAAAATKRRRFIRSGWRPSALFLLLLVTVPWPYPALADDSLILPSSGSSEAAQSATPGTKATTLAPTILASWDQATVAAGGTRTLNLTLGNPNPAIPLTGVAIAAAALPGDPAGVTGSCAGFFTYDSASRLFSLLDFTLNANSSCTVSISMVLGSPGSYAYTTGVVSATGPESVTGGQASTGTLTALAPPTAALAVVSQSAVGASATLVLTLTNPNASSALTGVANTLTLPTDLRLAATPVIGNSCGGTLTANAGGDSIVLTGGAIGAASSCAITTALTSTVAASYSIPTGTPGSANGGSGVAGTPATLVVNPGACEISTAAVLPPATVNTARTYALATAGCVAPLRFEIEGGALPPGMVFDGTAGILAGQPSATGRYAFTLRVLDQVPQTPARTFVLQVNAALQFDRRILASAGATGSPYSDTIATSGGVPPYSFALIGSLPPGLSLDPSTGVISGSLGAGVVDPVNFSVQVSDAATPANSLTSAFRISPIASRSLATATLPNGTQGIAYSASLSLATGSGGDFLLADGALPNGLSLDASTGMLSGTPTAAGSFWFTLQSRLVTGGTVSSAWRTYRILISNLAGLQFSTGAIPPRAEIGTAYRGLLSPVGGVAPFSFALVAGALPPGVTLDTATGLLHGIVAPTASPAFAATIQVTDARGATASQAFSFDMVDALGIDASAPALAMVGRAYTGPAAVTTGGGTTRSFSLDPLGGELPPGLTLDAASGALTGTPTAQGNHVVRIRVRDELGGYRSTPLAIAIAPSLRFGATSPLPDYATSAGTYSASVGTLGGTPPYSHTVLSGVLPSGILLAADGTLSGSTAAVGPYSFTVQVVDANGVTNSRSFTMNVVPTLAVQNGSLPGGTRGQAYLVPLVAQGEPSAFEFTLSAGSLPSGLNLMLSGVLSGTPTTLGTFNFSIRLAREDGTGTPNVRAFQVVVADPLSVSTSSPLPPGGRGDAYATPIAVAGGVAPYFLSLDGGTLPPGLRLNENTGQLSGVPLDSATAAFSLRVLDASGRRVSENYNLTIAPAIGFATPWLPNGTRTAAYSQTVAATGGTDTLAYSVFPGDALPVGLVLDGTTGEVSGTPSLAGSVTFRIRATDTLGLTAAQAFTVAIAEPLALLTASPLPAAALNAAYAQGFATTGGRGAVDFTIRDNAPPAILAMSPVSGSYGGFALVPGTYSFTVQARDADGRTAQGIYQHTVAGPPVLSGSLPAGTLGQAYSQALAFSGGLAPFGFSLSAGVLPAGLTLDAATGLIAGTPALAGDIPFSVRIVDATGLEDTRAFVVSIINPLGVSPANLPTGTVALPYSQALAGSGGVAPYTFAVTAGSLPTGFDLSTEGLLSGTPTGNGSFDFTVTATDSSPAPGPFSISQPYTLIIGAPTLVLDPAGPDLSASYNVAYSQPFATSGGVGPYTYAVSAGSLPAGLTLVGDTLAGTPITSGSFSFTVTATDAGASGAGAPFTVSRNYTLQIAAPTILIDPGSLPAATAASAYSQMLSASGGVAPYSFSLTGGVLPAGVALAGNGLLSGSPTASGTFAFTVTALDANNQPGTRDFSLAVDGSTLTLAPASLPSATGSAPYAAQFSASGGLAPYRFVLGGGSLPPGLSLADDGALSGTPTAAGSFGFTVMATDSTGGSPASTSGSYTLVVASPSIGIGSALPGRLSLSLPFSFSLQGSGGTAPYRFALSAGALPAGISLSASGLLSGTPTQTGDFPFTVTVTDANGFSGTIALGLSVPPPPTMVPAQGAPAHLALFLLLLGVGLLALRRTRGDDQGHG